MRKAIEPLTVTHPDLCLEWSDRNFPFTPDEEHFRSNSRVWWICSKGHEWKAEISLRAYCGSGCPYCKRTRLLKGFNDFATLFPELVCEWSEKNYPLMPDEIMPHSRIKAIWKCSKGHEWLTAPGNRARGNGCPVCAKEPVIKGVNDIATTHPSLVSEWSDKNLLSPYDVKASYHKQIIWKCSSCGKEYLARPRTKIEKKSGCPYCSAVSSSAESVETGSSFSENTAVISNPFDSKTVDNKLKKLEINEVADRYKEDYILYGKEIYYKHANNMDKIDELPIYEKCFLSADEASILFSIGIGKMQRIMLANKDADWIVWERGFKYIIREKFEAYLNERQNLDEYKRHY